MSWPGRLRRGDRAESRDAGPANFSDRFGRKTLQVTAPAVASATERPRAVARLRHSISPGPPNQQHWRRVGPAANGDTADTAPRSPPVNPHGVRCSWHIVPELVQLVPRLDRSRPEE